MRYRAFVSYSHADAKWAAWLHRKLETWRTPRRMRAGAGANLPERLTPIFRDREDLASAGELGPQIQTALADSEALIVVCSPEAARSRWVDAEVLAFKRSGRGARIYALIVAGEPNTGDKRECFPPAMRFELGPDGLLSDRPAEPLAADVRPGKDGKTLALMKLVSGLLGVELDALRQREARRRQQRMLAVTALALLVTVVTSFLAVQAVMARQAAERRQKQAEALVGFMLGDLTDKLSEVSRLDILSGVHEQAMKYFQSLPAGDVTDEALEQRTRALLRIGNVRQEQGELDKALVAYHAANKLAAALARAAPADVSRQQVHGDLLAFIGTMHWYKGDLDAAQTGFDAARQVLVRAQAHAPTDAKLLYQLSTLENNAGHVHEGRGRLQEATDCYRRMLALTRLLVETAPLYADGKPQLGLAHNNLAKVALLQGDLSGAVAGYRADVAVQAELAAADRRDNAQAERLVLSRGALGRTLALAGALDEGAKTLQLALDDAQRLHAMEPDSASFREDVGLYATQLARLRRLQGDLHAAQAANAEGLKAFGALVKQDPSQPGWKRSHAEALIEQAHQQIASAQPAAAREALMTALALVEPQLAREKNDRAALLAVLAARLRLSEVQPGEAGKVRLADALAAADAQADGSRDPRVRALRAELLFALGRVAEARVLAKELWTGGYRDRGFAVAMARHRMVFEPAAAAADATH